MGYLYESLEGSRRQLEAAFGGVEHANIADKPAAMCVMMRTKANVHARGRNGETGSRLHEFSIEGHRGLEVWPTNLFLGS